MQLLIYAICMTLGTACFAQPGEVVLEVSKNSVRAHETFIIKVKSKLSGDISVNFPPQFNAGYTVMHGMEQVYDGSTGAYVSLHYFQQDGFFLKEGNFVLGPALVKQGKSVVKSNTVNLTVTPQNLPENVNYSKAPIAFGSTVCNKTCVYQGEAVVLSSKIYSQFAPTGLEDYVSYLNSAKISSYPLEKSALIAAKKETVHGVSYYCIEHDKNLIFPMTNGVFSISPFRVILRQTKGGIVINSPKEQLTILPLPRGAPTSYIGFVGKLTAEGKLHHRPKKRGDIIHYEIVLRGKGNLHQINIPKLILPSGLKTYESPKILEDYFFSDKGAEGTVMINYTFRVENPADCALSEQQITYFDPEKKKYIRLTLPGMEKAKIAQKTPDRIQEIPERAVQVFRSKESQPRKKESMDRPDFPWKWPLLGGLIFVGFALLRIIQRRRFNKKLEFSHPSIQEASQKPSIREELYAASKAGDLQKLETLLVRAINIKLNMTSTSKTEVFEELFRKYPKMQFEIEALNQQLQESRFGVNASRVEPSHIFEQAAIVIKNLEQA